MKKIALILTLVFIATPLSTFADIQAPPGSIDGRTFKLGRGLGNLIYGIVELPVTWNKTRLRSGSTVAASYGIVDGAKRTIVRMGFGLYEVVTFPFPTYKGGFKSPLPVKAKWNAIQGYTDLPPELGFQSVHDYCRTQPY